MAGASFVVLDSEGKRTIIGRNIYAQKDDVHEILFSKPDDPSKDGNFAHIAMDPAGQSRAVILHKSTTSWGCDSGANDCNIVISRHVISSRDQTMVAEEALSGDVIVRLVLERAVTSCNALDLITDLITRFGQKGNNSFLICDPNNVWLLETSGKHWVAERIPAGQSRCVCDVYTIALHIEKHSDDLLEYAKDKGLWSGEGQFNFASAFNLPDGDSSSSKLLEGTRNTGDFKDVNMFELLRNDLKPTHHNETVISSNVSTLRPSAGAHCVHWFTGTPDPNKSVFKPFIFTPNAMISKHTISSPMSGAHNLYQLHQAALGRDDVQALLRTMEVTCVSELEGLVDKAGTDLAEFDELMKDCVETEVKFYR